MSEFVLTSDDTVDLPSDYCAEHKLPLIPMSYMIDGKTYKGEKDLSIKEFYDRIRAGAMPTTSQINPEEGKAALLPYAKAGLDILHIAFSSGLSGTYQNMRLVADELMEEYPGIRVYVVDSLSATMGEGLLVFKAIAMKEAGCTMDEIIDWLEGNKLYLIHNFTVNDLFHLYRGGRVSRTTAFVGTMVNVKPLMHMDNEGKLVAVGKTRGRKKSLVWLVDRMEQQIKGFEDQNDWVFVSHADCVEDAEYVKKLIQERFQIPNVLINFIGPMVGAHAGPGMVTLHFLGNPR